MSVFELEIDGQIAMITINNAEKLNALNQLQYFELGRLLEEVGKRDDTFITILIGKGKFFSSGADITSSLQLPKPNSSRADINTLYHNCLTSFVAYNLTLSRSFYTHPKILIFALNGPAIGLSGALSATADFIYCTPKTFLLTPFSSIGLVTEGVASRALVRRLGVAKANEALIMSKKIPAGELKVCGYVNEVFDVKGDEEFRGRVLAEVKDRFGEHLNSESLVQIKQLIRGSEVEELDKVNVAEVFMGIERFMKGVPQKQFGRLARREKKHKL